MANHPIEVEGFPPFPAEVGASLARSIELGGVDISHRCGGQARCTTCAVVFSTPEPSMGDVERACLVEDGVMGEFRLSCQIPVETLPEGGTKVRVLNLASERGWDPGPALPR